MLHLSLSAEMISFTPFGLIPSLDISKCFNCVMPIIALEMDGPAFEQRLLPIYKVLRELLFSSKQAKSWLRPSGWSSSLMLLLMLSTLRLVMLVRALPRLSNPSYPILFDCRYSSVSCIRLFCDRACSMMAPLASPKLQFEALKILRVELLSKNTLKDLAPS